MNFYSDVLLKDPRCANPGRCSDPLLLEPLTRAAVHSVAAAAKVEAGVDLAVFETFRSRQRQELLFAQGATQLKVVGVHGYGLACDLVKSVGGEPSWKGDFTFLRDLCSRFGLVWGGDWGEPGKVHRFVDACHVQRCAVVDQVRLFSGDWYPDDAYSPDGGGGFMRDGD